MPHLRHLLNKIKWTQDLSKTKNTYIHRGAPQDRKMITGEDIKKIGRSFLHTNTAMIPYHRIIQVIYNEKTVFQR